MINDELVTLKREDGSMDQWDVGTIWESSKDLPISQMRVKDFHELDAWIWEKDINHKRLVNHLNRIIKADLSYPIILSKDGLIMDGMHRLVKAYWLKLEYISAKQFIEDPLPDSHVPPV